MKTGENDISRKDNLNGNCTRKYRQQKVEVVIIFNNRKNFLLTQGIPLTNVGTLGTLVETNPEEKLLSGEYYLPVDVGDNG